MKAKAYLQQIAKYDRIIQNRMQQVQHWKEIALGITPQADGDSPRVQSSGSLHKMADAIDRWTDIEREIDELIDKQRDIIADIERLNVTEYDVLHSIYVRGCDFQSIADSYDKTYSWVTTIHGRALKNVQDMLDARANDDNGNRKL